MPYYNVLFPEVRGNKVIDVQWSLVSGMIFHIFTTVSYDCLATIAMFLMHLNSLTLSLIRKRIRPIEYASKSKICSTLGKALIKTVLLVTLS